MTAVHHPDLGAVRYSTTYVSEDPDEQVAQVIGMMARYVREDAGTGAIGRDARIALREQRARGDGPVPNPASAVWEFIRGRLTFRSDDEIASPLGIDLSQAPLAEVLIRPVDMAMGARMGIRIGDCDDYSMYAAALLKAMGIKAKFVTVADDPQDPLRFTHVYVAAYYPDGRRIPIDASHRQVGFGLYTDNVYRREEWDIDTGGGGAVCRWLVMSAAVAMAVRWFRKKPLFNREAVATT